MPKAVSASTDAFARSSASFIATTIVLQVEGEPEPITPQTSF